MSAKRWDPLREMEALLGGLERPAAGPRRGPSIPRRGAWRNMEITEPSKRVQTAIAAPERDRRWLTCCQRFAIL